MRRGEPALVVSAVFAFAFAFAFACGGAGAACSTGRDVPNNVFQDDSGVGVGPDGGALLDGGPVLFSTDGAADGVASCPAHCSVDLHSVIDCHGTILSTCK